MDSDVEADVVLENSDQFHFADYSNDIDQIPGMFIWNIYKYYLCQCILLSLYQPPNNSICQDFFIAAE